MTSCCVPTFSKRLWVRVAAHVDGVQDLDVFRVGLPHERVTTGWTANDWSALKKAGGTNAVNDEVDEPNIAEELL